MESQQDVGRSFGGFTESQIRTGVSGSGLSLVKWVKVDLVAAGQPAFAEWDGDVDGSSAPLPRMGKYERKDQGDGSEPHIRGRRPTADEPPGGRAHRFGKLESKVPATYLASRPFV